MTLLKKENVTNTADAVFNQKKTERSLFKDSFLIKNHLQRKFINYNRIRPKLLNEFILNVDNKKDPLDK